MKHNSTFHRRTNTKMAVWCSVLLLWLGISGLVKAVEPIACEPEPTDMVIQAGDFQSGDNCSISPAGDIDVFRFQGEPGEVWRIRGTDQSDSLATDVCIELLGPDGLPTPNGARVCGQYNAQIDETIQTQGLHTVLVNETDTSTMNYGVVFEKVVPLSPTATPLCFGCEIEDAIDAAGDADLYFFFGTLGDVITIRGTDRSDSLATDVCIELLGPDGLPTPNGARVCGQYNAQIDETIQVSGFQSIFVNERDINAMPHTISLQCLVGACLSPLPNLSANKTGTGDGTITSSPAGIDCGLDCSETYQPGTTVDLTPAPDASSSFIGWSGCDSINGDVCSVTMNASRMVTATFDHILHTLTADKIGTGTGTVVSNPGTIDCGASCSDDYVQGTTVDLTPTAGVGSVFSGWSGCDAVSGNVCSVIMNATRLVTATFNVSTAACATMTIHQTDTSSCPSLRTIVSLQDDQGLPVTGLVASNFGLDEDGMARAIQLETSGTLAVSLVIDKSGSLTATDLANIRQACIDFIGLLSTGDSVAVYQFDSTVRLLQDYTTDMTLAVDAVNSVSYPGGSTALYDGIFVAAEHAETITGRKGLVVLTDGHNNASSHTSTEAIERAIAAGVPVFTIGFGSADSAVLTDIADQTGGLYYAGVGSGDLQDLLARLGAVLNSQYVLLWNSGFVDGGVHGVAVEAQWPSCNVTATTTYTQAGSSCGASCMAMRSLPIGYAVGSAAPVTIAAQPDASVQTYAVEDIPPQGMDVSNIDNGGVLDNGKVKWGPFFDNQDRGLNYQITPPTGTQGNIGWSGVLSHDGTSEAICGDTVLPEGLVHPADLGVSGDNWRMEIDELTAYTTAWKTGADWSRQPSPIPLTYAVNAGYLWQNGEDYHYDSFLDPPWDAGIMTKSAQDVQRSVENAEQSGNAISSFNPRYYTPGIPVDVTLAISPPPGTLVYAVEETPPEGWTVTNISDDGYFDPQSNQIRWGLIQDDDTLRALTYAATPAATTVDAQSFFGQAAFDQVSEPIIGERTMLPSPCIGDTLHIHDVIIPSVDNLICSATNSIILGANVYMEANSSLELQAGTGVTFLPPLSIQKGGVLKVNGGTAP